MLFTSNDILSRCLLYVKQICELAVGTETGQPESVISLVRLDKEAVLTLDEFMTAQTSQQHIALLKLTAVQENITDIVLHACQVCVSYCIYILFV